MASSSNVIAGSKTPISHDAGLPKYTDLRPSGEKREMASQTYLAAKRQITEDDDEDSENILSFTANKKQRMQGHELTQREGTFKF